MPRSCSFRWSGCGARASVRKPALLFLLPFVVSLTAHVARAQDSRGLYPYHIDLAKVSRLYDTLYQDRITGEYSPDSTVHYDWRTVPFGELRYRVPTFLPTDVDTTREVVDYRVIPGFRTVFTVPVTAYFERGTREVGELLVPVERDFTIPGLTQRVTPVEQVVEDILLRTRRQVMSDAARAQLTAFSLTTSQQRSGGIKFEIPLPMPKSLESIFGPGEKTSITISGREQITIAGETRVVDPFIGYEGRQNQSLFPSLDMEQRLDVSLIGTIGDKVSIQVDHASEAIGDDANRVRLAYKGYEDEIIQQIELGNTSLSLPGSQLVSVSTGAQGLFGIKMLAKMGSTDITVIASKQEGESSSATFSPTGGTLGQTETRSIRDVDYVKNKYFYINNPYQGGELPSVDGFEAYRTLTTQEQAANPSLVGQPGFAFPDRGDTGIDLAFRADSVITAQGPATEKFLLLQLGVDYGFIVNAADQKTVVGVELFNPIPETAGQALAVRYVTAGGTTVGGTAADYTTAGRGADLVLKMLKEKTPKETDVTWDYMFRNIYNLGLTNIDGNTLEITIEDVLSPRLNPEVPDSSDVPYLRIFGLDQTDSSGKPGADGRIDLTPGIVDLQSGILQLPSLQGFAPRASNVTLWTDTSFAFTGRYQAQYDKSQTIYDQKLNPTQEADAHQYVVKVSAVSTSKTFRINAIDIVENSETITLDGKQLSRNTDYTINYETGEVELKESASSLIRLDSKISIDYEYKPLGGIGSSTLAGVSTVSKLGDNVRLGTTFLYESRATNADRPRLGEEPTRGIVGGITGSYQHQSRLLTDVANWLPYVDSDAPSTIQIDGEIAASLPNPNTKNEAYIDDFEGNEDTDRIPTARRVWNPASPPVGKASVDSLRSAQMWYNIEPELGVHRRDLNPELDEQENTLVQSLDLELTNAPTPADSANYTGLMVGFPGGGLDLSQGQFIEIWVNDFKPDALARGGKLHIDMGTIDEDFFDPAGNTFNDEDQNRDGFAAAFDDRGLDGLFNADEGPVVPPLGNPDDPAGDDIDTRRISGRYLKVNGTEANRIYDTEDTDRDGQLNQSNAYFSYEIDLADSAEIDIRAQYPGYEEFSKRGAHENDSWRLYRIKLSNHSVVSPTGEQPRLDEIRQLRIWFDNPAQVVRSSGVGANRIQICEFAVQGNRWEADGIRNLYEGTETGTGAEFALGTISTKTDPGVYHPPVNPNTVNEVSEKESSLALRYSNLPDSSQIRILKRFAGSGLNMTLYRDLNFWVHTDELRAGVEYYLRMATNDQNYYEIRVPFTSVYYNETGWARVIVKLADLTNLKFEAPDSVVTGGAHDVADPSKVYPIRMRGTPNLNGVRYLYAGVRNVSNPTPQSGEIWMDDIFNGDVMRDFDHAERLSANLSVAGGAISVGGTWARSGADYRGLRQTRGSGVDQTNWAINARTDLQYWLPLAGFSIPVAGAYSHNLALPKFPPNSDTEIKQAAVRDSLRTEQVSRGFNTSLTRRVQSSNFLMRYTLDRLKPTFSYSDRRGTSPSLRDTTTNMAGSLAYQVNWSNEKTIPLFGKNRFRWWFNSVDLSSSASRQTTNSWSLRNGVFQQDPYRYSAGLRNRATFRYKPFGSLETTYGITINRDLGLQHDWYGVNVGTEIGRSNDARVSFDVPDWPVIRIVEPVIEVQSTYNEDAGPNLRLPGDPPGTRNVNATRNDSGRLRFDFGRHVASIFKLLGWDPEPEPAGGRPAVPPSGAQPPDSLGDAPADTTGRGHSRPGLGSIFTGIGRMLTRVQPVNATIQHRLGSGYSRIPGRPDWAYRLGFTTKSAVWVGGAPLDTPNNRREELSYNLNSSVRLMERSNGQAIDLQARYAHNKSDSDFQENQQRSVSNTWPDLQLKFDNLEEFAPLKPILASGELTVDYRATHNQSGTRGEEPVVLASTMTLNPTLNFTWKNDLSSALSVSMSENSTDTRGSKSVTNSMSVTLDLRKNFQAGGGMNFFGKKINFKNQMETSLNMSYSKNGGERTNPGSTVGIPIPSTTNIHVGPRATYTFSSNINGSAFIDYTRAYSEAQDQTMTTVRVGISAVVTF